MPEPIHFDERLQIDAASKSVVGRAFEIVRERGKHYGEVAIPDRRVKCADCKKHFDIAHMPRFKSSGVVAPVMDALCKDCGDSEWRKKGYRFPRLVCVGCREVVLIQDVNKEPDGFLWERNRFYHVQECPRCAKRVVFRSHILEKISFYKKSGRPYI
jgi:hypothetical protein